MSKAGRLMYKCRRCGTSEFVEAAGDVELDILASEEGRILGRKCIIHHCGQNRMGIMDLVGADVDEET